MTRIFTLIIALLASMGLHSACNDAGFRSGAERVEGPVRPVQAETPAPPPKPTQTIVSPAPVRIEELNLACGIEDQNSPAPEFSGALGTKVRVRGELCAPRETIVRDGQYHLNFVLDFSGSMSSADPVLEGTCGRLNAARAVVEKMLKDSKNKVKAQVSVIQFDSEAKVQVQPTQIQNFAPRLTSENFCESRGGTNYVSAFDTSFQLLNADQGTKLLYFVTDGFPSGSTPDSIDAAIKLRTLSSLTLNAIFLSPPGTNDASRNSASSLLSMIASSPERVRIVADAAALAAELQTLEVPKTTSIRKERIQASIMAEGFGSQTLYLESLEADPVRPGVWNFVTEPAEIFGAEGRKVKNNVSVIAVSEADAPIRTMGALYFTEQR